MTTSTTPAPLKLTEMVDALVESARSCDTPEFLGRQFDAGLAWVHNSPGDGGLGIARSRQREVDDRLAQADRLADWHRNPMGIGMCAPAIAAHGTAEQRSDHLRVIFTAEQLWCQLFSEPGAGSDIATLATRAVRDRDDWVINGQKVWTSWGAVADFGLLLARTDPNVPKHEGLTAFLLDMRTDGVEVRPLRQLTGESEFSEIYLTEVRLADSARLGDIGAGWQVAITTLMNERVSIGGGAEPRNTGPIGAALRCWTESENHSAVDRDALTQLWIRAEVLRLAKARSQQLLATSGSPGAEGSLVKLGNALLGQDIWSFLVDLQGEGSLLTYDPDNPPLARESNDPIAQYLWSQSATIVGGTSDVMRSIIGERVLGLPKEPAADRGVPWSDIRRS